MNKTALKLFAIGVALTLNGMVYFIMPDFLYNNIQFKQILMALISVFIALSLVNLLLNIQARHKSGKKKPSLKDKQYFKHPEKPLK